MLLYVCLRVVSFRVEAWITCTGGILQRLDTDVHSAVTAKTSTDAVTAMERIVMLQR